MCAHVGHRTYNGSLVSRKHAGRCACDVQLISRKLNSFVMMYSHFQYREAKEAPRSALGSARATTRRMGGRLPSTIVYVLMQTVDLTHVRERSGAAAHVMAVL